MGIERSAPHPDSARHLLQLRSYEGEGSRVVLVEWERPRRGGDVLSECESCLLPPSEARSLYLKARHALLADVPALLRAAVPRPPREVLGPDNTERLPPIILTRPGLGALCFLVEWMRDNRLERVGRSSAVDLAVQEAARARGWKPPETNGQS
jgi:hypothetical protein